MAYANTSITAAVSLGHLKGVAHEILSGFERRRTYKRTLCELQALSTRELDDLGLSRSMLSRVAHEAVYGK